MLLFLLLKLGFIKKIFWERPVIVKPIQRKYSYDTCNHKDFKYINEITMPMDKKDLDKLTVPFH